MNKGGKRLLWRITLIITKNAIHGVHRKNACAIIQIQIQIQTLPESLLWCFVLYQSSDRGSTVNAVIEEWCTEEETHPYCSNSNTGKSSHPIPLKIPPL